MKIIVGLGNKEEKYNNSRHNVGFFFIEELAETLRIKWNLEEKFKSFCAWGDNLVLLKPETGMNNSGVAVKKIVDHLKIPLENVLVVFDDFSLPIGKLRFRQKGSSGGHNGMKSLLNYFSTDNIMRLKIGVGNPVDFSYKQWVLSNLSKEDKEIIKKSFWKVKEGLLDWLSEKKVFFQLMNDYN